MQATLLYFSWLFLTLLNSGDHEKGGVGQEADGEQFRMATYNIRYDAEADTESGNGWDLRKGPLAEVILDHQFDLVATQEGNSEQLKDLKHLLPGFNYVGHPYGGSDGNLHNCATFYRTTLFEVLDSGVFWFSETPDIPSIGWDATDRRICHWTKFRTRKTGKTFYCFNVHFYWRLEQARAESGPLLVRKIKEIAGSAPVICAGDFNSTVETTQIKAIKKVLSDASEISKAPWEGTKGTAFQGGVFQGIPNKRIDYIFLTPHFQVEDYQVLTDVYNGDRYPSDHLPVTTLLTLQD